MIANKSIKVGGGRQPQLGIGFGAMGLDGSWFAAYSGERERYFRDREQRFRPS